MADHETPDDPFLERRLTNLGVLPVPERPTVEELAARTPAEDADVGTRSIEIDRRRAHRGWLLSGAAVVVVVLVLIAVAAVDRSQEAGLASGVGPSLAGRAFVSVSVTESGVPRTVPIDVPSQQAVTVTLTFSIDGRSLRASAGCNDLDAPYTIEGDVLRVDRTERTERLCPGPYRGVDDWLAGVLMSSPTVALDGERLTLTGGATAIDLLDRDVEDQDLPLVGTWWSLESVVAGGTVTSVYPSDAHFSLLGRGSSTYLLVGNDGCADFSATLSVEGDHLATVQLTPGTEGCPDGERNAAADGFVAFGAGATFEIDGSKLTVTNGAQGLVFRGGIIVTGRRSTTVPTPSTSDTTDAPGTSAGIDHVAALLERRWELASVVVDGARSSAEAIEGDRQPWLRFGSDPERFAEVVEGGDRCGDFTGDVEVRASTITFEPNHDVRDVPCFMSRSRTDAALAEVLDGEATYVTDGMTLTISRGGSTLELRAVDEGP